MEPRAEPEDEAKEQKKLLPYIPSTFYAQPKTAIELFEAIGVCVPRPCQLFSTVKAPELEGNLHHVVPSMSGLSFPRPSLGNPYATSKLQIDHVPICEASGRDPNDNGNGGREREIVGRRETSLLPMYELHI